jgi:putative tricarboxylic transport membrane protein
VKINDAVFGVLLLVLGAVVLVTVQAYPKIPGQNVGPALFPGLVACGLAVCGIILVVRGVRARPAVPWFQLLDWTHSRQHLVAFATLVAGVIAYVLLAGTLGFLIVAPMALFALFLAFGVRATTAVIVAVLASLAIWYVFYKLLRVPLPWGLLEPLAF